MKQNLCHLTLFLWTYACCQNFLVAAEFEDVARGNSIRDQYFRNQVSRIRTSALADIRTKGDWLKAVPRLRQEYFQMLGLWPMPEKTSLKPVVTGIHTEDEFTVEKVQFQSSPGLYVTGNLYLPRRRTGKVPAVLYVCGHGNVVVQEMRDGRMVPVSYGSKAHYHYHPVWFAQNGYACLAIDTLQLGEIEGIHHGTYNRGMWWWQCLGYTPAGIECWNAIRALDYLETRPEIDGNKLGVTGRSGGGATSWWIAAADERIKCAVPVAGIADLQAHLLEGIVPRVKPGVITGHCDCMYFYNLYQWDFTQLIALCAPRAVMLGNSDEDPIFPVPGYQRMVPKVKEIYGLMGASEKFALLETKGIHVDTVELRNGINSWMNRWLKGIDGPSAPERPVKLAPQLLKVLDQPPVDQLNTRLHETFVKTPTWEFPQETSIFPAGRLLLHRKRRAASQEASFERWWTNKKDATLEKLREDVFRNWASGQYSLNASLDVRKVGEVVWSGIRLTAWDFQADADTPLRLFAMAPEVGATPRKRVLEPLDEKTWQAIVSKLGREFSPILVEGKTLPGNPTEIQKFKEKLESEKTEYLFFAPRGIGLTRWSDTFLVDKKPVPFQIRRRFALLGQTLDGQRVWDIIRAAQVVKNFLGKSALEFKAEGEMAALALYAGMFEPQIAAFDFENLSASHYQGPIFLNVLRVLDIPQALAMLAPRPVKLKWSSEGNTQSFEWTRKFAEKSGWENLSLD